MSEYERLCDIIQNNKQLNNTFNVECDDKVRIKEASGKGDAVLRGKKKLKIMKIGNVINAMHQEKNM